ncbi:Dicer, partial [Diplonema papillatum]
MSEPEPVYDDFRALPSLRLRPTSEELINQLSATEPKISDDNVLVIVKKLQDALSDKSVFDEFSHVGSKVLKLCCAEWVFRSFLDENVSLLTYYIRELTSSRKVEAVAKRWGVDLLVSTKDNKSLVYVYLGILAEVDLNLAALVLHRHLLAHADVETWLLDYKIVGAYCKEKSKTQHWSADKKGYIATWESTEVTLPWDSRHHPKNPLPYEEEHEARRMLFYTICRAIFLRIFAPLGYDLIEDSTDEENQEFNCYITKKTESGAVVVQADRGPFEHEHEAAGAVIIPFLRANMPTRGRFGIRSVKQLRGEQTVPVAEHQCLVDHLWTKFKTVLRTPAVASLPFSEDLFVKFSDVIEYIQGQLPDNLKEYIGDPIFEPAVLAEFLKEHDIVERFQFKEVDGIWYGRCFYYHRDIRLPKNEVGDRSDAADEGAKANDKVSANLFDNEDVYDKLCFPDEKYPHCETVDDYLTVRSIERKRLCDPGSLGQAMGKNGTQSVGLKLVPDVLLLFISEATYNASVDYAHSDDRIKKNSSTKPHIVVDIGFLLQMNYTLYQLNPNIVTRTPLIILRWPEGRPYDGPLWIPFTADSTFTVFEDGRSREEVLSQEARKHYFEVYKENCIKNDTTAKKAEKQKDEDEKRNYVENFVDDVTKRELENILVGDNDDLVARLKHHCRAHGIAVCEKETNRGRVMSFFKDHLQRFQDRLFETDTDEVKRFKNIAYLQSALRAQSISKTDNLERQEFLGDAVLDLCVALDCAHVAMAFRGCDLEHSIRGKYFTPTTQNGDVVDGEVNGLYPVT